MTIFNVKFKSYDFVADRANHRISTWSNHLDSRLGYSANQPCFEWTRRKFEERVDIFRSLEKLIQFGISPCYSLLQTEIE